MTTPIVSFAHVTKRYDDCTALDDVSCEIHRPSIVALVGKNGSGKTTLLNHVVGLALPTSGACTTLGCATPRLGAAELARIGVAHQRARMLTWMKVEQLVRYVASYYDRWDRTLENTLIAALELDRRADVATLSAGTLQKLAMVLASCHRPELLVLDEPLSDLDPGARQTVLRMLLDCFNRDAMTILISSHLLHDLETIVDRVLMLDRGRLVADSPLDDLRERFAEWTVTSRAGALPERWTEPYVRAFAGDRFRAVIVVDEPDRHLPAFLAAYDVEVETRPLSLERIVSIVGSTAATAPRGDEYSLNAGRAGSRLPR